MSARMSPRTTAVSWDTTVRAIAVIAPSRNVCDVSACQKIAVSKFIDGPQVRSRRRPAPGAGGRPPGPRLLYDAQVRRIEVVLRRDPREGPVVLEGLEGRGQRGADV